jgi:DNA-binding transcriptional MerR regulator
MAAPKRDLFKAADVCAIAEVQSYVLRTWEAEFPRLGRATAGGGPRVYSRRDIELVLQIKSLVFGEGLTLAGARRRLEEADEADAPKPALMNEVLGAQARERIRAVRQGLEHILRMLSERPGELVLVAPTPPGRRGKNASASRARSSG